MTREDLIKEFEDTMNLSKTKFADSTKSVIENTSVIIDGSKFLNNNVVRKQNIRVIKSGTIQAALGVISKGKRVAILNFADPYVRGGLVLQGETTQEECICRCTNLYDALGKQECLKEYYKYNSDLFSLNSSDRIIYSKDVTIIKGEDYDILDNTPNVDVITCPAPMSCDDILIFEQRIRCILGVVYFYGVDILILGAWGCGAFGNSAELVSQAFKNVLDKYKLFDDIIFAIRCTSTISDTNYRIFKNVIGG